MWLKVSAISSSEIFCRDPSVLIHEPDPRRHAGSRPDDRGLIEGSGARGARSANRFEDVLEPPHDDRIVGHDAQPDAGRTRCGRCSSSPPEPVVRRRRSAAWRAPAGSSVFAHPAPNRLQRAQRGEGVELVPVADAGACRQTAPAPGRRWSAAAAMRSVMTASTNSRCWM